MCLLHEVVDWSASTIHCRAISHRDADNPLRSAGVLHAAAALEYAGQAMAVHGALTAGPERAAPAGFLASVRDLHLMVTRLDDLASALDVRATLLAGDSGQALYRFSVQREDGSVLAQGKATVVLSGPAVDLPSGAAGRASA
jgi:predicted hotdog family 3-hydroxylacyl-ACP dehydratase